MLTLTIRRYPSARRRSIQIQCEPNWSIHMMYQCGTGVFQQLIISMLTHSIKLCLNCCYIMLCLLSFLCGLASMHRFNFDGVNQCALTQPLPLIFYCGCCFSRVDCYSDLVHCDWWARTPRNVVCPRRGSASWPAVPTHPSASLVFFIVTYLSYSVLEGVAVLLVRCGKAWLGGEIICGGRQLSLRASRF